MHKRRQNIQKKCAGHYDPLRSSRWLKFFGIPVLFDICVKSDMFRSQWIYFMLFVQFVNLNKIILASLVINI